MKSNLASRLISISVFSTELPFHHCETTSTSNVHLKARLAAEAVEGAALAFEGVHDIEGGDGLALGVFGVGDGVADDRLEEGLEDAPSLLV